jgi:hypothetical protein
MIEQGIRNGMNQHQIKERIPRLVSAKLKISLDQFEKNLVAAELEDGFAGLVLGVVGKFTDDERARYSRTLFGK